MDADQLASIMLAAIPEKTACAHVMGACGLMISLMLADLPARDRVTTFESLMRTIQQTARI